MLAMKKIIRSFLNSSSQCKVRKESKYIKQITQTPVAFINLRFIVSI